MFVYARATVSEIFIDLSKAKKICAITKNTNNYFHAKITIYFYLLEHS